MNFSPLLAAAFAGIAAIVLSGGASAQDVLIRGATVHTLEHPRPMADTDILVRGGKVVAIAPNLPAGGAVQVVEAQGRSVTPGIFGSLGDLGVDDVVQSDAGLGNMGSQSVHLRPEFDVRVAFNPRSTYIPVARIEGVTWTMLAPRAVGSFLAGQGAAVSLDGVTRSAWPGSETLFLDVSASAAGKSGGSRAAIFMLLRQAAVEARSSNAQTHDALLSTEGRKILSGYLKGGRVVARVNRAADISRLIEISGQMGFKLVIVGGAEAWIVADELAAARVPVVLDPLDNLPDATDRIWARPDNAVLLQKAGVLIAFTVPNSGNDARKLRQSAGNAVALGLEWRAALAAITINPARIFGVEDKRGSISVGKPADMVMWSADPLDVNSASDKVWIDGRAVPMASRQTELRDRYKDSVTRRRE